MARKRSMSIRHRICPQWPMKKGGLVVQSDYKPRSRHADGLKAAQFHRPTKPLTSSQNSSLRMV